MDRDAVSTSTSLCLLLFIDLVLSLLQKWNDWYSNVYPLVLETVHRYNAYVTPGLDGNQAATKEIQTAVGHHMCSCHSSDFRFLGY